MKLEKIKEERKKNKIVFLLKDSNEIFANTIRRLILEEVPTLAVEDLEIKENSSALFDEMLGLRLGLLPIKTDLKSYRLPQNEEEITEKAAQCTLQIQLKSSKKGYVFAEDAKSSDPKCTFVYGNTPVTKLLPKQKVDVTMTAVMGQGKNHIKWAPGMSFYRKEAVIKLGNVKNSQKIAEVCSDGVFTLKGSKLTVNKDNVYESKLIDYYAELDSGINVEYTGNLVFSLESWGQLTCKEMLTSAAKILVEKTEQLESQI